eukprot:1858941-Rhodomonas_salina.1
MRERFQVPPSFRCSLAFANAALVFLPSMRSARVCVSSTECDSARVRAGGAPGIRLFQRGVQRQRA